MASVILHNFLLVSIFFSLHIWKVRIQADTDFQKKNVNEVKKKKLRNLVVLEKTLESPLNCKEIQPVHPKGDQSGIFIGMTDVAAETPILWPPDEKS